MPLEFIDGNGDRDTVYIGYDPSASAQGEDIDTVFNEGWIIVDTSRFNVYFWQYPNYGPTSILTTDTVRKTDIRSLMSWNIGFVKGKMPVTLKWADRLLNSPNLPFPDISPRPRARIDLYCGSGEPGYINCPLEYEPLTLTNYITPDIMNPVSDSLFFDGSGNDYYNPRRSISNLFIEVVPHNYKVDNINNAKEEEIFNVLPNPFDNSITFFNLQELPLDILIIDPLGIELYKSSTNEAQISIDTAYLEEGICFLIIKTKEKFITKKLIKM